jgi:uncharacterized membrane protein
MMKKRVLLVGESRVSNATHPKGWDSFSTSTFDLGAEPLVSALKDSDFELNMPAHLVAANFPLTMDALESYQPVILSDIGSNTLLLHPDVWLHGKRFKTG